MLDQFTCAKCFGALKRGYYNYAHYPWSKHPCSSKYPPPQTMTRFNTTDDQVGSYWVKNGICNRACLIKKPKEKRVFGCCSFLP